MISNLAYDIITLYADDVRDWQSQFSEYSLSHITDIAYNYLTTEDTERERVQMAEKVGEEIWLAASAVWNEDEDDDDDYEGDE